MRLARPLLALSVVVVLLLCAAYEVAFALGAFTVGSEPGQGPALNGFVSWFPFPAMIVALVLAWLEAARGPSPLAWVWLLVAPAAAAFVLALFWTPDPYYAPALRRISYQDDGLRNWIVGLAIGSVAAGLVTARWRRTGLALTQIALLLCVLTLFVEGDGH